VFVTRFINTMRQDPMQTSLIPIPHDIKPLDPSTTSESDARSGNWDYLYEPDAKTVLDELLVRYIETLVYQAAAENIASEQSARMVAMKAASDNAQDIIDELQLIYNKNRQAAITKEISEIVGGAAAL
jgi:F-type H+-transporting ATPase subunit gamma